MTPTFDVVGDFQLPAALNSRESRVLFWPVRVHVLTCEYLHIDIHMCTIKNKANFLKECFQST